MATGDRGMRLTLVWRLRFSDDIRGRRSRDVHRSGAEICPRGEREARGCIKLVAGGGTKGTGMQCNARANAVACGTAVSAVASGPSAACLLWLPALVATGMGLGVMRRRGPIGSSVP